MTDIPRSGLPPLPPEDSFTHPVFAWMAQTIWSDERIVSTRDALTLVAHAITTEEVVIAAELLESYNQLRLEREVRIVPCVRRVLSSPLLDVPVQAISDTRHALATDFSQELTGHFMRFEINDAADASGLSAHPRYAQELYSGHLVLEFGRRERLVELTQINKDQQTLALTLDEPTRGLQLI